MNMAVFGRPYIFEDRNEAGKLLGEKLSILNLQHPVILALPRGGVPVAASIAKKLQVPLEVFVVRKIGYPLNPEFGIGAVAEDGTTYLNKPVIQKLGLSQKDLLAIIRTEKQEILRRALLYREGKPLIALSRKSVIIIDDGIATGSTVSVAIRAVRRKMPKELILAVPMCADETAEKLSHSADVFVCLVRIKNMSAIGYYYRNFAQVSDGEVAAALKQLYT